MTTQFNLPIPRQFTSGHNPLRSFALHFLPHAIYHLAIHHLGLLPYPHPPPPTPLPTCYPHMTKMVFHVCVCECVCVCVCVSVCV